MSLRRPVQALLLLCLLALLGISYLCTKAGESPPPAKEAQALNVALIIVDTLSSFHMDPYSPGLGTTPRIDEFSKKAVVFERAYAASPWTKPSITSIITGLMPLQHGVTKVRSRLSPDLLTLAEMLKGNGYRTYGAVSHTFLDDDVGFAQGFERYTQVNSHKNTHSSITSQDVTKVATGFLDEHQRTSPNQPFFLMTHYFDPHYEYRHHPEFNRSKPYKGNLRFPMPVSKLRKLHSQLTKEDVDYLAGLYDEEVAYTDFYIGELFDELKKRNLDKNTVIVITADHGEEFMEHGWLGHIRSVYEQVIRVPLIISIPSIEAHRIHTPVSHVDIVPTVLEKIGIKHQENILDGISLLGAMTAGESSLPANRRICSEVDFISESKDYDANMISVIQGSLKLSINRLTNQTELFDLSKDSTESINLASAMPDVVRELTAYANSRQSTQRAPNVETQTETPTNNEELEKLKNLGYL